MWGSVRSGLMGDRTPASASGGKQVATAQCEVAMRSNKSYTNVTFTKRVDYEGGTHRPPRAPAGVRVCSGCGAVYVRRRWILASDPRATALDPRARATICPACDLERKHQVRGLVRIEGAFAKMHRPEIVQLLRAEAGRAAEDNPLGRIISIDRTSQALTVMTTTEHLAQRLGRAIQSAYDGTIDYKFSHGEKFARVMWRRD
jgi:hypothetical protein